MYVCILKIKSIYLSIGTSVGEPMSSQAKCPHAIRTPTARYPHAIRTLPARYRKANSTLSARYRHAIGLLSAR